MVKAIFYRFQDADKGKNILSKALESVDEDAIEKYVFVAEPINAMQ
ncbi:MAG: hypothetical protein R8M45_01175 [Ghiorsea sp.]